MTAIAAASTHMFGYVFANRVHLILLPAVLTVFVNSAFGFALPLDYYVMITCTTAGGCIYNMYTDDAEDAINYPSHYRVFGNGIGYTRTVIFACFLVGFLLAWRAGWVFVVYGGVVHLLTSFYSRPLRLSSTGRQFRIKETPLKNVYAACIWSLPLVLTPHVYVGETLGTTAWLIIVVFFGLALFGELMWDLRDLEGDRAVGFRTLPIVIGEAATYRALALIHAVTCIGTIWAVMQDLLPPQFLGAIVHLPAGLAFLSWYRGQADKWNGSHLYIVYAGAMVFLDLLWFRAMYGES